MKIKVQMAVLSLALAVFVLPAAAGQRPTVRQRQINQQKRIAQGVKSGQLTRGETRQLEKNQVPLNREVKNMRQNNGGKLTPRERVRVNRQQNRMSHQIYRAKHNNRTR